MAILVTGGAGYIGSHMALELVDAGEDVIVLDNLSTGFRTAVPDEARLVVGDIADQELVRSIVRTRGVEAVIHFAGSIIVPESVADPLGYYHNNTAKSRSLIEALVSTGVKNFVFSSTAAVYGNPATMPVAETTLPAPVSPYGSSKLMTEIMLGDTARAHDFRFVALRYFNVAGADPKGRAGQSTRRATHLIKVACEAALGKRDHLEIYGSDYPTADGTCIRDYVHVSDLARAHSAALAHLRAGGTSDIFNCGYGRGYSVTEVVETVRKVSGIDFEARAMPRRAGDPAVIVAASEKIRSALGWAPSLDDLAVIVAHALAWERTLAAPARAAAAPIEARTRNPKGLVRSAAHDTVEETRP